MSCLMIDIMESCLQAFTGGSIVGKLHLSNAHSTLKIVQIEQL